MKKFKPLLSIISVVIFLAIISWYVVSNWSSFENITISNPLFIIPAIILVIITIYASGSVNELAMEPHGVRLTKKEVLGLNSISRFTNQIAPSYLGASVRALYFKKKYNVSYAKFSSSFAVTNILQFILSGSIALGIYVTVFNGVNGTSQMSTIIGIVLLLILVFTLPTNWLSKLLQKLYRRYPNKILERLSVVPGEYSKVRSYPGLLPKTTTWMIVLVVSSGLLTYCAYELLGFSTGIPAAIFIAAITSWSMLISITPAGLGIREGLMAFGAQLVGIPVPVTLAVSLLLRALNLLVGGILSTYFAPKLLGVNLLKLSSISKKII